MKTATNRISIVVKIASLIKTTLATGTCVELDPTLQTTRYKECTGHKQEKDDWNDAKDAKQDSKGGGNVMFSSLDDSDIHESYQVCMTVLEASI
jgi:hypothetical protein